MVPEILILTGIVDPGGVGSAGSFTISGTYTQGSSAKLQIDVDAVSKCFRF